jgi:hypothetical protein
MAAGALRLLSRTSPALWAVVLFLLSGPVNAGAPSEDRIRVGVSSRTFEKVNRNDAAAALKAWGRTVAKERDMAERVSAKLYDEFEELKTDFLAGSLEAIAVTVMDFPRLGVAVDSVFVLSTARDVHVRYALIVHREGGIEALPDLRGRRVLLYAGQRMQLAGTWLASLGPEIVRRDARSLPVKTAEVENPAQAIFQVFFRQADAVVVARESFALARELNPQVGDQLRSLAVSPPFVPTFFLFRPSFQGPARERLESAVLELHATPGGQQVLTVFQSAKIVKRPFAVLADTLKFLDAHPRRRRRGGKTGALR